MTKLYVTGRSNWSDGDDHYYGCVGVAEDKSDRTGDLVCSLPTDSPSEALYRAYILKDMLSAQAEGAKLVCNGRFI